MKGLLLSYKAGMWDAVVTGTKTNTRRSHKTLQEVNKNPDNFDLIGKVNLKEGHLIARFKPKEGGQIIECKSRYHLDEISFLQEPTMNLKPFVTDQDTIMYQYRDKDGQTELQEFKQLISTAQEKGAHWSNKMFMPASDARYYVKIKRIEIERLRDISDDDCVAEGIVNSAPGLWAHHNNGELHAFNTPKKAYFSLYNSINRNAPFNPWVFSYHFELCNINGQ
jgi:hypothetical protein